MRSRASFLLAALCVVLALVTWKFANTSSTARSDDLAAAPSDDAVFERQTDPVGSAEPQVESSDGERRPLTHSASDANLRSRLELATLDSPRGHDDPIRVELVVRSELDAPPIAASKVVWTSLFEKRVVATADGTSLGGFPSFSCDLAPDVWEVHVEAEGFHPLDKTFNFTEVTSRVRREGVSLWPIGFTLLRARTSEGRSWTEVAAGLGVGLDTIAAGGVHLWTLRDGARGRVKEVEFFSRDNSVGFHPAFWLGNVVDGANVVGFYRHGEAASVQLALSIDENESPWIRVDSTQRVAVFEVDLAVDMYSPAALSFRVVARHGEAPPEGTLARIETRLRTTHRAEFNALPLDAKGFSTLDKLSPGDYTLVVQAPGHTEHRHPFTARFGERIELGELVLDVSRELEVHVRDVDGRPLRARVHVGPFDASSREPQGFSPRFEATDEHGIARIPPSTSDIVLRADVSGAVGLEPLAGRSSRLVRVDADSLAGRVELVVSEPTLVEIKSFVGDFTVETNDGVVLDKSARSTWLGYLQPATYAALARGPNGNVVARVDFDVRAGAALSFELR